MLFISSLHVQYTSKNRSSYDNLCIWFEPLRYDFVRYSDMADTLPLHILNPGPSLHWKSYTEDKKCILRIYHSFCSLSNLVYSLSLSPRKSETYITQGTGTYSIRKSITSIILSYFKFHFRRRELFFTFWTFGHILLKLRELIKFNYP